jgi:hypothetical protein
MKTQHYSMNVGLNIGKTNEKLSQEEVVHAIRRTFPNTHSTTFVPEHDGFEDTIIAHFHAHPLVVHAAVHDLSAELQQMAIAYRNEDTKEGSLAGPQAQQWGSFSPEYFQTANGGTQK